LNPKRWAQIEDVFHRAAESDPQRRIAVLDQACGDDSELREQVEALLSSDHSARSKMQAAVRSEFESVAFSLIGKTVSHYRILGAVGGGGMGLVYRGEDIKLGRRVAIKFLPEESAKDPAALQRFEREARSASALEHPNICPIYEFGEHEGQPFLVMQLLDGQTLRELIALPEPGKPAFSIHKLIDVAIQISAGLHAAHSQGIIHRDIKPANIFVTRDGEVKILDFGLAKLARTDTEPTEGEESASALPEDLFLSRPGIAMGTAAYMSPEQIRGEKLDARTDIFSFGLVLYEMAVGQRAFPEKTGPAVQAAILNQTPTPVRQLNPAISAKLEQVINKTLAKNRDARYPSAAEVRAELEALQHKAESRHTIRRSAIAAAAFAIFLVAAGAIWFSKLRSSAIPSPLDVKFRQLTTNSPENRVLSGTISRDGKYLWYSDIKGGHVRLMETGETRSVPLPIELKGKSVDWEIVGAAGNGTEFVADVHPAEITNYSSHDASIWSGSLLGGPPRKLRDNALAFAVSPDGSQISFGTKNQGNNEREIWLMDSNGEHAQKVLEAEGDGSVCCLVWFPGGQRIGYIKFDAADNGTGVSRDLSGGPVTTLFPPSEMKDLNEIVWMPDGRLIYSVPEPGVLNDTCNYWVRRIDLKTGARIDNPRRLTNWSGFCPASGSVTADGKRLTFLGWTNRHSVYLADLEHGGTAIRTSRRFTLDENNESPMDWTADGKSVILLSDRSGNNGIFKQRIDDDTPELITTGPGEFHSPRTTPDGKWVVWFVKPEGIHQNEPSQLMRAPISGGAPELIFTVQREASPFCARAPSTLCVVAERSEDRKQVVVTSFDPVKGRGRELLRFTNSTSDAWDWACDISPDGSRLAFFAGADDPIRIFSLRGGKTQTVPTNQLQQKRVMYWASDSRGLFVAHDAKGGSELVHVDLAGNVKALWKNSGGWWPWAVQSPDGRHLAIQGSTMSANMWMMENF
jgi:eukaryotic-like serine/threonine-protein kinase